MCTNEVIITVYSLPRLIMLVFKSVGHCVRQGEIQHELNIMISNKHVFITHVIKQVTKSKKLITFP